MKSTENLFIWQLDPMVYERPLPPVPSHRERLANSAVHLVNQHASFQNLLVRARKKRQIPLDSFDENGGYTISHDGSQTQIIKSTAIAKVKQPRKTKLQNADPFQLVSCTSFNVDKKVRLIE